MQTPLWTVEFSETALTDFDDIIYNTLIDFGQMQAERYRGLIAQSLQELSETGPGHPLVSDRSELRPGMKSLPIRRRGSNARHILFFTEHNGRPHKSILIVRILHDAMDFADQLET